MRTAITYSFGASTLGNLTYSYDSLGRRTQVGGSFARTNLPGAVATANYDAANELLNWNGTTISYDANGNMLSDGLNAFSWNARNQVAALNGASLQYDGMGRRIKNAVGNSLLYDGENSTQELSGTTPTANIWTGGTDELFQRVDSNGTVVPLSDALGSTIGLVDSSGNIQTTYSYDPFGTTTTSGSASTNPSQFTGRENEGSGLYYYRARYVETIYGRFISEDPLGFSASGPNFYAYALDTPTNLFDPSGLETGNLNTLVPGPNGETASIPLAGRKDIGNPFGIRMPGQTWLDCLSEHTSTYSVAGIFGLTDPYSEFFLGNDVSEIAWGDASTGVGGLTVWEGMPNGLKLGAGKTLTYGRRTSSILDLNIWGIRGGGKGGLAALGKVGVKSAAGKFASYLVGIGEFKTAVDVGLTLAEEVGCAFQR